MSREDMLRVYGELLKKKQADPNYQPTIDESTAEFNVTRDPSFSADIAALQTSAPTVNNTVVEAPVATPAVEEPVSLTPDVIVPTAASVQSDLPPLTKVEGNDEVVVHPIVEPTPVTIPTTNPNPVNVGLPPLTNVSGTEEITHTLPEANAATPVELTTIINSGEPPKKTKTKKLVFENKPVEADGDEGFVSVIVISVLAMVLGFLIMVILKCMK